MPQALKTVENTRKGWSSRQSGRPRQYAARQRVALNMVPEDILRVDEYAIINGLDRGKAIQTLIFQALAAPPVVQAVAEHADLTIPEPQSQLAPDPEPQSPSIGGAGPSWLRKLTDRG